MSNEIVKIYDTSDLKFGKQFRVGQDIYVIRLWLADDGFHNDDDKDYDAYQLTLRKVINTNGTYKASSEIAKLEDGTSIVKSLGDSPISTLNKDYGGDMRKLYKAFKDLIFKFLEENNVEEVDGYPLEGTLTEQILWLVKNDT